MNKQERDVFLEVLSIVDAVMYPKSPEMESSLGQAWGDLRPKPLHVHRIAHRIRGSFGVPANSHDVTLFGNSVTLEGTCEELVRRMGGNA